MLPSFNPLDLRSREMNKTCATISPAETGARASILCQLCNMSYVYDTGFDWDPVKCTFANGTGDPAWLKRPYNRNGWDIKL